jgi:hypothetical protein
VQIAPIFDSLQPTSCTLEENTETGKQRLAYAATCEDFASMRLGYFANNSTADIGKELITT